MPSDRVPIPRPRSPVRRTGRHPAGGPGLAVLALLLLTGAVLLVNQQHSGDPLKIRRELRKF